MEGCWGLFKMHMTFKKSIENSSSINSCHSLKCLPTEVVYLSRLTIQWPCTVRGAERLPWPNLHFIYEVGVRIILVKLKPRTWWAKCIGLETVKWAEVVGYEGLLMPSGQGEAFSGSPVFGEDPIQAMRARGLENYREVNLVDVWVRACSLILTIMYRRATRENQQKRGHQHRLFRNNFQKCPFSIVWSGLLL